MGVGPAGSWGDEDHSQFGSNFVAILDCGFGIADLLYRCALYVFIKLTEYLKSQIYEE